MWFIIGGLILAAFLGSPLSAQDSEESEFIQVETPLWEQRHQVLLGFRIEEDGKTLSTPKIMAMSRQEAIVTLGSQVLIGNKDEIEDHLIGYDIQVTLTEYTEARFQLKFIIDLNRLSPVEDKWVSVAKGNYNGGHILEVGKELTLVDLATEDQPGPKISCTLEQANPTGWVNVSPISVMAKDKPLEEVLQSICEQAEIDLKMSSDNEAFQGEKKTITVFFTEVPCEQAMIKLGDFCGFSVTFKRESNSCIIQF